MTSIRWDHHENQWAARFDDGTIVRSPSIRELEQFLEEHDTPARRKRERLCNAVAVVTVTAILCVVTAVAALLW